MNIKITAYNNEGVLFNFDLIVKSDEDFNKVIKVLNAFYDIKKDDNNNKGIEQ